MRIEEAMPHLRAGKKIRCGSWPAGAHYVMAGGETKVVHDVGDGTLIAPGSTSISCQQFIDSFLNGGWEVADA